MLEIFSASTWYYSWGRPCFLPAWSHLKGLSKPDILILQKPYYSPKIKAGNLFLVHIPYKSYKMKY